VPQKVPYAHQKKPLTPTPAPEASHEQQKLRKNFVVGDREEGGPGQHKYGYKDKL
jgi:hypothetical protein